MERGRVRKGEWRERERNREGETQGEEWRVSKR
jgi:hypothetical protein